MKKLLLPLLLVFTALFSQSCHSELDLTAPWKDIPVVYGLLSLNSNAQYIRIEKAFLDDTSDANELAQVSDSLYYDESLVVQLTREVTGQTIDLERVDGTLEGFPKEEGVFANDPNWLYKTTEPVIGAEDYTLTIKRGNGLPDVTATTTIVKPMTTQDPDEGEKLNIREGVDERIRWKATSEARIFDVILTFYFMENIAGEESQMDSVIWIVDRGIPYVDVSTNSQKAEFDGVSFYNLLNTTLEASPTISRNFRKISIDIIGGASDLEEYVRITQANTGITSAQEIPTYTNLSEGLGIFSSVYTLHIDSVSLSNASLIELSENELTRDLNF